MSMTAEQMAKIAAPYTTVSDRIRALDAAGAARADIARFLGKRYQHVRNVLEGDAQRGGYVLGRADLSGAPPSFEPAKSEGGAIEARGDGAYWLRVAPDGSLPLPAAVATALDAAPGSRVFARFEDGVLRIISAEAAMEEARALVRKYIPPGVDLVEGLLATRRAETEQEQTPG